MICLASQQVDETVVEERFLCELPKFEQLKPFFNALNISKTVNLQMCN